MEFALVLPLLLLLVAGGIDLARAYFMGVEVSDGASQAAIYVADNSSGTSSSTSPPTLFTDARLGQVVNAAYAGTLLSCPATVTQSQNTAAAAASESTGVPASDSFYESVTVTCKFTPLTALLPLSLTLKASSASYVVEP